MVTLYIVHIASFCTVLCSESASLRIALLCLSRFLLRVERPARVHGNKKAYPGSTVLI